LQTFFQSPQYIYEKRKGSGVGSGSGSVHLTNGSGSGEAQNIWILRIRFRITNTAWRGGSSLGRGRQSAGWTARGRGPRTPPCRHPAQPSSSSGGPRGQTAEPRVGRKNSFTSYTKILGRKCRKYSGDYFLFKIKMFNA
jgi:hypothetical protein